MVYDNPKELPCSVNMHSTTAFINIGRDRMVVGFTPMQSTTIIIQRKNHNRKRLRKMSGVRYLLSWLDVIRWRTRTTNDHKSSLVHLYNSGHFSQSLPIMILPLDNMRIGAGTSRGFDLVVNSPFWLVALSRMRTKLITQ
jgi:hypothetical protein